MTGVINGGVGDTYQTGDTINGTPNGNNRVNVTVATATGGANGVLATINNVDTVNFRTLAAQVINAQLFTGVNTVQSSGSDSLLTVANGALASTYKLSDSVPNAANNATGGLTVGIRAGDTNGTTDAIKFSVAGVGIAGNVPTAVAAIDAALTSNSQGIEIINVDTTGANFFSVTGSVAAATASKTLNVTGNGTNTIDARGLTQATKFDMSASTGTNVLRLDNVLTSGSTVLGGTGADTLRVAPTAGNAFANLTVTGVETLRLGAGSTGGQLLFAAAPNFATVQIDGTAAQNNVNYSLGTVGSFGTLRFTGDGVTANAGLGAQFVGLTVTNSFAGTADTVAMNFDNKGTAFTAAGAAGGFAVQGTGFTANGVETINVTLADTNATSASSVNLTSNTLQTVSFGGLGNITSTIGAQNAAGTGSALTAVNLSGMTSTANVSAITLAAGAVSANTIVTASSGGTTLTVNGAEVITDSLVFNGGAGIDTLNGGTFAGSIVANLGAGTGGGNVLNTGNAANTVSVTADTASAINTINTATAGVVSLVATGVGSTNTISGAGAQAGVAAVAQIDSIVYATDPGAAGTQFGITLNGQALLFTNAADTVASVAAAATNAINAANLGVTAVNNHANVAGQVLITAAVPGTPFTLTSQPGGNTTSTVTIPTANVVGVAGTNVTMTAAGSTVGVIEIGSANNDTITGGGAADTINGAAGADTMTGGAGVDTFGQLNNFGVAGQSIVASAQTLANGGIAAGNTITFATGAAGRVDRITDFVSGTDKLDVVNAATAPTTLIAVNGNGALTANTTYVAYGNYVAATGVFTVAAGYAAGTADAIVVTGNGALTAQNSTGYVVLVGLNQALVAADFV